MRLVDGNYGGNVLIIMVGPPGCGKSTLVEALRSEQGYNVVSSDSIREELFGDAAVQDDAKRVFNLVYKRIDLLGRSGENVVYDATNCIRKYREKLVSRYSRIFSYVICMYYDGTVEACKERNRSRDRVVPEEVIDRMFRKYQEGGYPTKDEGFDLVMSFDCDAAV